MATTTNYGWTTPDDTALVKDGAAAIRTLGSSVDTTTKNLNPSTTLGDIEYRSSTANTNTRLPIGTSGQALTVVAGAPSWAASPTSVLTTTGDTLYASAANTLARLGIGSTGNILTVAGGVPTWAAPAAAGGMTLLDTVTLSGSSVTSNTFSSAYTRLFIHLHKAVASTVAEIGMRYNGDSGNNYSHEQLSCEGTAIYMAGTATTNRNVLGVMGTTTDEKLVTQGFATVDNPSNTDTVFTQSYSLCYDGSNMRNIIATGIYNSSAAITSITFIPGSGTFTSGTIKIYGVN